MALDHVNVYALDEGDSWTLIDSGMNTSGCRDAWAHLMAHSLAGKPVRRVILTHHHPDHVGLAGWFQTAQGAELWSTRTAWLLARMLQLDKQPTLPLEAVAFYRGAGVDAATLRRYQSDPPFNFADVVAPMPLGFRSLGQGDVVHMGGRAWDVHIGNGHAPAHATFWSRDDALVLSGDQVLPSISPNLGVYATEPDADPLAEWLESCTRLSALARPDHVVLGGHKLPFMGLPLRLRQLIENHHQALARLWEHLEHPRTAVDCFAPLFRRDIGRGEYGLALAEAVAHLNHLRHNGKVARQRQPQGAWLYRRRLAP